MQCSYQVRYPDHFFNNLSCQKKDPVPDCGCNAVKFEKVENVRASYNGYGSFNLYNKNASYLRYVAACVIDTNWTESADINLPDYTISGNIRSSCITGETLIIIASPIQITAIKKD